MKVTVVRTTDLDTHRAVKRWILGRLGPAVGGVPDEGPPATDPETVIARLPPSQRRIVAKILKRIVFQDGRPSDARVTDTELLHTVIDAFIASRRLVVRYADASGVVSERRIEPHGLLVRPPRWYVLAWDLGRKDSRSLRLDRMTSAVPMLGLPFAPRRLEEMFEDLEGMPLDVDADPD